MSKFLEDLSNTKGLRLIDGQSFNEDLKSQTIFVQDNQNEFALRIFQYNSKEIESQVEDQINDSQKKEDGTLSGQKKDILSYYHNFANQYKQLDHPYVAKCVDYYIISNRFCMQMQKYQDNLQSYLKDRNNDESQLFRIAFQLFSAVSYIRSKQFMLKSLSSQKLLVDTNGRIKIYDIALIDQIFTQEDSLDLLVQKDKSIDEDNNNQQISITKLFNKQIQINAKTFYISKDISVFSYVFDNWLIGIYLYSLSGATLENIYSFLEKKKEKLQLEGLQISILNQVLTTLLSRDIDKSKYIDEIFEQLRQDLFLSEIKDLQLDFTEEQGVNYILVEYFSLGEFEKALELLDKLIEKEPDNLYYLTKKGVAYHCQKNYQRGVEIFKQLLDINPKIDLAASYYSKCCLALDPEIKHSLLEGFAKETSSKSFTFTLNQLGYYYVANEKYEQALEQYQRIEQITLNYKHLQYNLGVVYYYLEEFEQAEAYFEQVLNVNDEDVDSINYLGLIKQELSQHEESISLFERVLEIDSDNWRALFNLGISYFNLEKYEDVLKYFFKVLEINPDEADALNYIGLSYCKLGELDLAQTYAEKSVQVNPDLTYSQNNLGLVYLEKEMYEEAAIHFQIAIELKKDHELANYNLGLAYYNLKQYEDALIYFKKALEIKDTDDEAVNYIGLVYLEQKKYEEAIKYFEKTKEINPQSQTANYNLGLANYKQKNYEIAKEYFEKQQEIDEDDVEVINYLGLVQFSLQNISEAIKHFNEVLQIKPDHELAIQNLGLMYYTIGQFDKSLRYYLKIYEMDDQNIEVLQQITNIYFYKNDYENTRVFNQRILDILPDDQYCFILFGDIYFEQGLIDKAIDTYKFAMDQNPDSSLITTSLANAYFQKKDYLTAASYYYLSLTLDNDYLQQASYVTAIKLAKRSLPKNTVLLSTLSNYPLPLNFH